MRVLNKAHRVLVSLFELRPHIGHFLTVAVAHVRLELLHSRSQVSVVVGAEPSLLLVERLFHHDFVRRARLSVGDGIRW